MTSQPNPDSKRSKRRANRNFTMSRPNRRAEERHKSAERGYELATTVGKSSSSGYTKPGAQKRW